MKICFITTYPPTPCGIATYSQYLINNFLKLDPKLDITVLAEIGAEPRSSFPQVIPCFVRSNDYAPEIVEEVKKLSPDIVHVQHEFGIFGKDDRFLELLKGIKGCNCSVVVTLHTVYTKDICVEDSFDCESYEKSMGEICDTIVMHLDAPMKRVMERIGINPNKIKVVPHGTQIMSEIDKTVARKKLGLPEKGKILLSFGFVRKLKDELTIINAISLIKRDVPDVYLFIAGNPQPNRKEDVEYLTACKQRVIELGLEDRVIFSESFIGEKDLPYMFSACDVCVFAYRDEYRSASGSFHLAIGAGKPVILSRIPKFEEEAIFNISDEIMTLPHSPESFAKVAVRLLSDDEFYTYITDKIQKYADKTSWENTAIHHLKLYQTLIKGYNYSS